MAHTLTVVKFCEENSVEAVPTTWLAGSDHCYWPLFLQDKVLQAIRRHYPQNTCWLLHKAEVFRGGTYDDYLQARNKARKADYDSDLNSDCEKFKRKVRRKKVLSSDEESELSSGNELVNLPPKPKKTILSPPRMCYVNSHQPISIDEKVNYPNPSRNVSALANTSRTDMKNQAVDVQTCSCCQKHKYDETLKSIHKQHNILVRNILTQVLEELQQLRVLKSSEKEKEDETASIFSKFHFLPINDEEQLNNVEEYLQDERNFTATINELSKLGGSNVYNLVKRCLNSILSNAYAAEFSWHGNKKKKVFSNLKLAKVLIGSCEKSKLAENTKVSEETIKKWLRRAKERSEHEQKKKK